METKIKNSEMSGKMAGLGSINTNTLSNPFCQKMRNCDKAICSKCYSGYMLETFRKSAVNRFEIHSQLLSNSILEKNQFPNYTNFKYVRLHSHGELINKTHMDNYINLCNYYPNTTFALWTKRKSLVMGIVDKPDNLIIVFSNPIVDKPIKTVPTGFDKVFNVLSQDWVMLHYVAINCGSKSCIGCLNCYKTDTEKVIYEQLKVYKKKD